MEQRDPYSADENEQKGSSAGQAPKAERPDGAPEPPSSWRPSNPTTSELRHDDAAGSGEPPRVPPQMPLTAPSQSQDFERARRYITVSQVCAIISLFIGGVVLSTVSLVFAIMGFRVTARVQDPQGRIHFGLRRTAVMAIGMSVLALVFNAVTLVLFYPVLMEAMQSGDYASLFGASSAAPSASGSSTWG